MTDVKDIRRELDFASICDGNTMKLLNSHLQAAGVPKEYIFFPLLSTVSSFLGKSTIKINDDWEEACSLWTAVVARKGSRRSTVLDRFMAAISEAKENERITAKCDLEFASDSFTGNTVHLRLFEDLGCSNLLDPTVLKLAKKSYDIKSSSSKENDKAFVNVFSFLPPDDALALLDDTHVDLSSRFLVACPKPKLFKCSDFRSPMPSNTPSLTNVLDVLLEVHTLPMTYTMTPKAKATFDAYYDVLQDGMIRFDKDVRNFCILSKAAGQLARLGATLSALRQALKAVVYREALTPANWNVDIDEEDIEAGKLIMDYVIDIRFTLLKRVSSFKAQEMYSVGNSMSPAGNMMPMHGEDKLEPQAKRQRIAAANSASGHFLAPQSSGIPTSHENTADSINSTQDMTYVPMTGKPSSQRAYSNAASSSGTFGAAQSTSHSTHSAYRSTNTVTPGYFTSGGSEPDEFYLPGRRDSTYVNCSLFSSSDLYGYDAGQQQFIRRFGYKLKKLLEYRADCRISPSCCAQRHLMPPIPKSEMARYDTQTRYPVSAAKEYLTKVADLGLGIIESTWHATNNRRSLIFQKFTYDKLKAPALNLLEKLQVTPDDFMAAFTAPLEGFAAAEMSMAMPSNDQYRRPSPNVTSSSTALFPVPYPFLQQSAGDEQSMVHVIIPESADESESSMPNSEASVPTMSFLKTEPGEG